MNTAAVAATSLFTGNVLGIPLLNPATVIFNLIDELVVISECFQWPNLFIFERFDRL
jgi:hypothetical protein